MAKHHVQSEAGTPRLSRRKSRWRLMLIGDHGKIVTIPRHKTIFVSVVLILILSLLSTGASIFLYLEIRRETQNLEKVLVRYEETVKGLEAEKEILSARLVVAGIDPGGLEVKKEAPAPESAPPEKSNLGKKQAPEKRAREKPPVEDGKDESGEVGEEKDEPLNKSESEEAENTVVISEMAFLDDFKADYDKRESILKASFKLVNRSGEKLRGYILVLLKNPEKNIDMWVAMEDPPVEKGDPSDYKSGRFFEIAKFKTIQFVAENVENKGKFVEAEVYIYDQDGNLLLKQTFSLNR